MIVILVLIGPNLTYIAKYIASIRLVVKLSLYVSDPFKVTSDTCDLSDPPFPSYDLLCSQGVL